MWYCSFRWGPLVIGTEPSSSSQRQRTSSSSSDRRAEEWGGRLGVDFGRQGSVGAKEGPCWGLAAAILGHARPGPAAAANRGRHHHRSRPVTRLQSRFSGGKESSSARAKEGVGHGDAVGGFSERRVRAEVAAQQRQRAVLTSMADGVDASVRARRAREGASGRDMEVWGVR
jgi:hypothetical protein